VLEAFLPVVLLLGAGALLRVRAGLGAGDAAALNAVVIRVGLPATILLRVPSVLQSAPEVAWVAAVPWLLLAATFVVVAPLCRAFGWSREVERALVLTVGLGNTSFLGYPVVRGLLGEEALGIAVVLDQLGSFLALSAIGPLLAREQRTPGATARAIVTFPPFVALLAAVALGLAGWPLSGPLAAAAELAAGAMVPLALVALGLGLRPRLPADLRAPLAVGLLLKLVVLPALVLLGLGALRLRGASAQVALLESAMPPMVTAAALAESEGLAPELARAMAGLGLLAAIATLPLAAWLAERWL
jgi:predicted permease